MQYRDRDAEAARKTADELRREPDLGHQHQRLPAACQHAIDGGQINLGLAAAGDSVQQQALKPVRLRDGVHRDALRRIGRGRRLCLRRWGLQAIVRVSTHPSTQLQDFDAGGPAHRNRRERLGHKPRGRGAQHLQQSPAQRRARQRVVRERVLTGGREPPDHALRGIRPPPLAQQRRQRGKNNLAGRMMVIVRRPAQQFEHALRQQRHGVQHLADAFEFFPRQRAFFDDAGDKADHLAFRPEGNAHPRTDDRRGRIFGREVIE